MNKKQVPIKHESNYFKLKNHSLFIDKKRKEYRLFVGPFDNQETSFHRILDELYKAPENSKLELRIASPGGLVVECQQLVNLMQNKFKNKTVAYIDSHASSAGAITFANADERIVYWNSRIMFHNYSGGYGGDYHKMKTRIDFDSIHVIRFLASAKKFFNDKEWNKLINGKEYWFDALEMLERGIATHLILNGKKYKNKKAIKKLKKYYKELEHGTNR